ncbi:MAG: hypothetical protein IT452_21545 [Planctomycetia bacterium]|nr:hypothetical protein [Planctomycetia bacterium]
MPRRLAVALAAVLAALPARAEDPAVEVLVECVDGSLLAGSLPANTEIAVALPEGETRIPLRDVLEMSVSGIREQEAKALETEVKRLRDLLAAEDAAVREAASAALEKLGGPAAPFIRLLEKDEDPEVAVRARGALEALRTRGALQDPRDMIVVRDKPVRGWLATGEIEVRTGMGAVKLRCEEIRRLTRAEAPAAAPAAKDDPWWPPPLAMRVPAPPLLVTITLTSGTRLVGVVAASALAMVDETGAPVPADNFLSATRDPKAAGPFKLSRRNKGVVSASFAASEIALESGLRPWKIPVETIASVTAGSPRFGRAGNTFADLVQDWIRAQQAGEPPPAQRFWASIKNQPANPWNSEGRKLGMTWTLARVQGDVALVGTDAKSNAYKGDTSTEMELPILAVRRRGLPVPEGVNPNDFYNGWSGAEIRMTKPVPGLELKSLEAANAIIREEFGEGWEMAEFHMGNGGWHWWGAWTDQGDAGK